MNNTISVVHKPIVSSVDPKDILLFSFDLVRKDVLITLITEDPVRSRKQVSLTDSNTIVFSNTFCVFSFAGFYYVFFIGPQAILYVSKYSIITGEVTIKSLLDDVCFIPTWDGVGGQNKDTFFLYLKTESGILTEVCFDPKNDATTFSQPFPEDIDWFDVGAIRDSSRSIFYKKGETIILSKCRNNKWKNNEHTAKLDIEKSSTCVVKKMPHLFISSNSALYEIFLVKQLGKKKLFEQNFKPGKFVAPPVPHISASSVLRSCVDTSGIIHVFFISNTGVLTELVWNNQKYTWIFQNISSLPNSPTCILPSKLFKSYESSWECESLGVCKRGDGIEVFVNVRYCVPNIVPIFLTCLHFSLDPVTKIWRRKEFLWRPKAVFINNEPGYYSHRKLKLLSKVCSPLYQKECYIVGLPEEILLSICSYLHQADLVAMSVLSKYHYKFITKHDTNLFGIPEKQMRFATSDPIFLYENSNTIVYGPMTVSNRVQFIRELVHSSKVETIISLFGPGVSKLPTLLNRGNTLITYFNGYPFNIKISYDAEEELKALADFVTNPPAPGSFVPMGNYWHYEDEQQYYSEPEFSNARMMVICCGTSKDDIKQVEKLIPLLNTACGSRSENEQPHLVVCSLSNTVEKKIRKMTEKFKPSYISAAESPCELLKLAVKAQCTKMTSNWESKKVKLSLL